MNNIIIYSNFLQIVDYYIDNFDSLEIGKISFDCEFGLIEFGSI
jgi:hypothetical protein